jgi:hypothetical protein
MKIAALMPLRMDPEKSKFFDALACLESTCDEIIVLHDRPDDLLSIPKSPIKLTEEVIIKGGSDVWNDWCLRTTLLARAAACDCRWVMWLDDDETLGASLTRERVHQLCDAADAASQVAVSCRVRTLWSETHYRIDGPLGLQTKSLLQLNPFMVQNATFEYHPSLRLHHFPLMTGPKSVCADYILHWGMRTPSLREKTIEKYSKADPEQKFVTDEYGSLMNETGIALEPL